MDHDETQSEPVAEVAALRRSALQQLTRSIHAAAQCIQQIEEGELRWGYGREKYLLDLLRMLPIMLRLPEPSSAPAPISYDNWEYPKIPVCKICGQGPGAHWSADCPDNPNPPAIWRPE